jgi:type IV pilus assembly protein PilV
MMKQSGMIMVEVLISLVVLAIGILGLASLQVYSLRATQSAYLRSVATDLASSMSEQIQANRAKTIAAAEAGGEAKYYGEGAPALPKSPDYARFSCSYDAATQLHACDKASDYNPDAGVGSKSQLLAAAELGYWLDLVKASLPLGAAGGAVICRDDTPDDGVAALNNSADAEFSTQTGCLASTSAAYANAPYVIKIWWADEKPSKNTPNPALTRFALSIVS